MKKLQHSWIVNLWSKIFGFLARLSVFVLIRKIFPRLSSGYTFVEYYVATNTAFSVMSLSIVTYRRDYEENVLLLLVMSYGIFRTLEIFVYQVNVLLFDEYRAKVSGQEYAVRGYRRMVILLLHNYIEIICWFGVVYMWFYRSGDIALPEGSVEPTFFRVFHESLLLMFSFSPDQYSAQTDIGISIFSIQAIIGLFMTLIVLARFIGVLPPPLTMDEFEKEKIEKTKKPKK